MQVDKVYKTKSDKDTQELGEDFAKEILNLPKKDDAIVIGLSGNLGGGKTTFLQGFAKGLGIKEKVLSPTFLILKKFEIRNSKSEFTNFYHIDCYRLKNEKDILELGWKEIISDPKNIVAVEWPEIIKKALPKNIIEINFNFAAENTREINFKK